jgi:hypothetical protein
VPLYTQELGKGLHRGSGRGSGARVPARREIAPSPPDPSKAPQTTAQKSLGEISYCREAAQGAALCGEVLLSSGLYAAILRAAAPHATFPRSRSSHRLPMRHMYKRRHWAECRAAENNQTRLNTGFRHVQSLKSSLSFSYPHSYTTPHASSMQKRVGRDTSRGLREARCGVKPDPSPLQQKRHPSQNPPLRPRPALPFPPPRPSKRPGGDAATL